MRLSWSQPEDLLPHALAAAVEEGRETAAIRDRWLAAGGSAVAPVTGATPETPPEQLRRLARELLSELDELPLPDALLAAEPDDLPGIRSLAPHRPAPGATERDPGQDLDDRIHGAWLGRAAGCLLGKPVEKIPREGIRAIAESTGNWPIASYFTAVGLDAEVAAQYPWNRRSASTSLVENIDGMPEDDDLNFPLVALDVLERVGRGFTTRDIAEVWLASLPGGRVFTAERIVYRNLLDGYEPEIAADMRNPFRDWIGAQIRADVYGWVCPGEPLAAAALAFTDARLSHRRNGVYGAMFVAAACAAAVVADSVQEVIDAGLGVVPAESRYARAIRFGVDVAKSSRGTDDALDAIHAEYGGLHWVHVLNNSALLAFALTRGAGDFESAITLAVTGGWDTDSTGATAGSITGALAGGAALPARWIAPLRNRLATSLPGFDGVGFDELARRTSTLARQAR